MHINKMEYLKAHYCSVLKMFPWAYQEGTGAGGTPAATLHIAKYQRLPRCAHQGAGILKLCLPVMFYEKSMNTV